jgi:predicted nucleotidyltransferase
MTKKNWTGVKFYLFGSTAKSIIGRDIDLLIEYDNSHISIADARILRIEIAQKLTGDFQKNIDIILLSKDEHLQTKFISLEDGIMLLSY